MRDAVLEATLELLTADGYAAVTVPRVADLADVHSSTVYRRWGGRAQLVADAVRQLSESTIATPDTGNLAGDLRALLGDVVGLLSHPPSLAVIRALAGIPPEFDQEISAIKVQFWRGRFDAGTAIVERAISRGELATGTDPQQVFELLVGPAYLRALLSGFPLDNAFTTATANHVLRAFRRPDPRIRDSGQASSENDTRSRR
ncbi:TetR/AcrR family transcriptional regulator [Kribbella sp. NPDC050124]|uniref:TetR/AcrR family transcriptional regulator n=1 Tax=Kribbella sp. NPDC050124 TaxID=3364114 RepID=UPI003795B489